MWDVSPHRNEEMDTLRKLGVYWLPDSSRQQKWVGNPTAYPWHTARSPVQRWWSVRYITFYLFISTCDSNVFHFFQAMMTTTMFIAAGKNTSRASRNPSLKSSQFVMKKISRYKFSFFSSELFLILHISRTGFWEPVMSSQDIDSQWVFIQSSS